MEEYAGELAQENIAAILEKKYSGWQEDERTRRRAFAALQRMGYSYGQIREGMRREEDFGEFEE